MTAPSEFSRAPPAGLLPPVSVRLFSVSDPPGPSTSNSRNGGALLLRAIVVFKPLIVTVVVITGRPFAPTTGFAEFELFTAVSVYVQPGARLIVPPPPLLAAVIAATSPAAPPLEPPQGTKPLPPAEATPACPIVRAITAAPVPEAIFAIVAIRIADPLQKDSRDAARQ